MMHTCIRIVLISIFLLVSSRVVRGSVTSTWNPMKEGEVVATLTDFDKEFEISMEIFPTEYSGRSNIIDIRSVPMDYMKPLTISIYFMAKSTSASTRGIEIT